MVEYPDRSMPETSDEQLACDAQAGCRASFNELARRFQSRLLHFLQYRTWSLELAEDLVQETFLQVYRSLHTYRRQWRFSTWLFTIAARLASRHRRAELVHPTAVSVSCASRDPSSHPGHPVRAAPRLDR